MKFYLYVCDYEVGVKNLLRFSLHENLIRESKFPWRYDSKKIA